MENLPNAATMRQLIEDCGASQAAVFYLEALVSAVLDAGVGAVDAETAGKVLLAEELLTILTGSEDVLRVRAWMRARGLEPYRHVTSSEPAEAPV